ncbi:MAG TPA: cytochrome c-type biogenesis protein [Steroidobacteraceae bacterium]|jgi:cytochrome c-type biogenesis protein CcmH
MRALLVIVAALLSAQLALAIDTAPAFSDPEQQARYERIIHQLRCLQCRSESIADSGVTLAADLRRQVREMMAAGKSDDEIYQHMVDRYGDYVLYNPPLTGRTLLLWGGPILLLVGGAAIAVFVIARKSKLPDTDPADPGLGAS